MNVDLDYIETQLNGRTLVITRDGRTIVMPSGGDGEGEGGDPPEAKPETKPDGTKPETFSQEDVSRIASREKKEGREALAKNLGFDTVEAMEIFVKAQKKAEKDRMGEVERRETEAKEAQARSEAAEKAAAALVLTTKVERALERAGVPVEASSEIRNLVSVQPEVSDEELKTTVEALKTKFPALFSESGTGGPKLGDGDPGNGGGNGDNNKPKPGDAKTAADKLFAERHPEVAARNAARQPATT